MFVIQVYQHSKVKAAVMQCTQVNLTMPYVQGNQICDSFGNPLLLRGAHIQSTLDRYGTYATPADHYSFNHLNSATFDVMVNNWHMNTVRIATSDYMWQKW